ncbi:putative sulfatase [Chthoniobacter flavus]|nr:sulfatase [Chthoniobacter flavus]TCO93592.1 putative sulfatase [Chthoniobacter flavus]
MKRLLLAGLVLFAACHAFAAAERWNILFIFADDWGRYASCYKGLDGRPTLNDVVQTPNIDRVARDGVIFKNAFVNAPSCTPCRSSLLSGRYFFNCNRGAILQGAIWDSSIPSFPLMLHDAGYQIGKSYKVWSPGKPVDAPIGGQQYAYEKSGRLPNRFSMNVTKMVAGGMTVEAAREKILDQVRGNFKAFLADQKPDHPWLYFFGPTNTHRPWEKGSGKKLWGLEPDSVKDKMPKFLPDVPEVREDVVDNLGEAQAVDAYVGVLMKMLEETGQLDHTLVVISGDHGMGGMPGAKCNLYDFGLSVAMVARVPGGKGGRVVDDFVSLPDLAPTFMEVGGVTPPAGLYGRSMKKQLQSDQGGQIDPERTWVIGGRERHVATAREDNLPYPMRCLRTPKFLYIRNFAPDRWPMGAPYSATATGGPSAEELEKNTFIAYPDMDASPTKAWLILHQNDPAWKWHFDRAFGKRPAEELYDLQKDPDETKNVADDPAYATRKDQLSKELMGKLTDAADPRVTGDGLTFDRPPFTDPVTD